jgi:predicted nuclease of predicted toxin-antitoxin system
MWTLLDAMYPSAIASELRHRGFDCIAAQELEDLRVASDPEVWAWAQEHGRALVTEDVRGFWSLATAGGSDHFGLILTSDGPFSRHQPRFVGALIAALDGIHTQYANHHPVALIHWLQP